MPNLGKMLKDEIARIGRREAKAVATPLQKRSIKIERATADLRKRLLTLEKENKRLLAALEPVLAAQQPAAAMASEPPAREWISGKGVKRLRAKLGLSQHQFARLAGASDQAVYLWERRPGMLKLRDKTRVALLGLRGLGAREAKKRLAEMGEGTQTAV